MFSSLKSSGTLLGTLPLKWSNEKEKEKSAVNRWVQVKNSDLIVRRGEI